MLVGDTEPIAQRMQFEKDKGKKAAIVLTLWKSNCLGIPMGLIITSWDELKRCISGFIKDQMINPNLTITSKGFLF